MILESGNDEKMAELAKDIKYNYGCQFNHELYW